jgi:hypothetical protein
LLSLRSVAAAGYTNAPQPGYIRKLERFQKRIYFRLPSVGADAIPGVLVSGRQLATASDLIRSNDASTMFVVLS